MKDTYIKFETAKLAKEKGIIVGEYGTSHFFENGGTARQIRYPGDEGIGDYIDEENGYLRPTQSQLQTWLRDKHNIQVYVYSATVNMAKKYRDYVAYVNLRAINDARDEQYQTYEEALEVALLEGLKLIKK